MATPPRAPRGTGFIDFGRYLEANRPAAQAMAGRIAAPIMQQGQAVERNLATAQSAARANNSLLPGAEDLGRQAADVGRRANALGSFGGVAAAVQDLGPKSSMYGLGANLLDAGLTGAAGGERFEGLRSRYGGLFGRVTEAAKSAQEAAAKPRPAAPAAPEMQAPMDPVEALPDYKRDQIEDRRYGTRRRYDFLAP